MTKDFLTEEEWLPMVRQYFKNDYRERGKIKWNGFFLSDHTAKLKQEARQEAQADQAIWAEQQSLQQIQEQVRLAYEHSRLVQVQESTVNRDNQIPPIQEGHISGFFPEGFYLDGHAFDWQEIRFAKEQHGHYRTER
ncbi:hypothetical protein LQZ24_01455 [Fructobacillus sp. M1-13]|uniref:DNA-directed RNA polymerase beta subunit n=1 Tax=Fructobacillus papyriferae TaxID=2713171 RepID=A0ABS5QNK0_9LACO|nr:hypothetical protein [Fructobacillus papyriferae]MBS9334704.1 hypothetical protein [Fructobacillus papyriferae]MCD2158694.1 hypothetical protein [Fructobacillus papyriferae]